MGRRDNMSEKITISKQNYYILYTLIAILLLALLMLWKNSGDKLIPPVVADPGSNGQLIKDGIQVPISEELKDFLEKYNYRSLILINNDARVKTVNLEGNDKEACATTKGGVIQGIKGRRDCQINGTDILNMQAIAIIHRSTNPRGPCTWVGGVLECDY